MGSEDQTYDVLKAGSVHEMLDLATGDLARLLEHACGAFGVAVAFDPVDTPSVQVNPACADRATLARDLVAVINSARVGSELLASGQLQPLRRMDRDDATIVHVPMVNRQALLGHVAFGLPPDRWDDRAAALCAEIVGLLGGALDNARARHLLEIDLADATRRTQRLSQQIEVDPLTKAKTITAFEKHCRTRLLHRSRPAAMLAIDLDHLKRINDIYGHRFGDRYLCAIVEALRTGLPQTAIIGRTGGDEFCVLLDIPEAGRRSYLDSVVRQLRLSVQRTVAVLGKPDLGKLSIGISLFPLQAQTYEHLHGQADCALYASKRGERNATTVFSPSLNALLEPTTSGDRRPELRYDRITAHFQPVFDLKTGQCVGAELLPRWLDRDGFAQGPDNFAWMFRDHRFATELTLRVFDSALEALSDAGWTDGCGSPDIWLNVTGHDLMSPEFVFDLQATMAPYGLDWSRIVIEVNEECLLGERNGQAYTALQELRQRGCRIALDDFGSGQTGLKHVSQWPVDIIKIDRSFVQSVATSSGPPVAIKALVMIARELGQQVLAEGIETADQARCMIALGCEYAQGSGLAEPMTATALISGSVRLDVQALDGRRPV